MGLPIEELEASGIMMPVSSVECHYKLPSKMGDVLHIVTTVKEMPMARINVYTTITNKKTGDVVCTGKVVLGFIHSDTRRPTRVPENLAVRLRPFFE